MGFYSLLQSLLLVSIFHQHILSLHLLLQLDHLQILRTLHLKLFQLLIHNHLPHDSLLFRMLRKVEFQEMDYLDQEHLGLFVLQASFLFLLSAHDGACHHQFLLNLKDHLKMKAFLASYLYFFYIDLI